MPCFAVVLALAFPRLVLAGLWLFTSWLVGVFTAPVWPVLGFFLLPTTNSGTRPCITGTRDSGPTGRSPDS